MEEEEAPRRGYFDKAASDEVSKWIEAAIGERVEGDLLENLKDGVILCKVADKAKPGSVRYKASKMPFVQMENIAAFLRAASQAGVPDDELFETVDLFEGKDPIQVLTTIRSYSRYANKLNPSIPLLGPQLAQKNAVGSKEFKSVDIPAWNPHQYGYMGGANQSTEGVSMGRRREITQAPLVTHKPPPKSPNIFVPSRPVKPSHLSAKKTAKPNVFGEASEESEPEESNVFKKLPKGKHTSSTVDMNKQLMAYSVQSQSKVKQYEDEAQDESIYAYDEVYDSMKAAERSTEKKKKENISEPKYMDNLLASKKQRERDRQRALDIKLKRDREKEEEEYGPDVEKFVTSAYKKQQEEMEKELIEEDKREKESTKDGMSTFYKSYLNKTDDANQAALEASAKYTATSGYSDNDLPKEKENHDNSLVSGLNKQRTKETNKREYPERPQRHESSKFQKVDKGKPRNSETLDFQRALEAKQQRIEEQTEQIRRNREAQERKKKEDLETRLKSKAEESKRKIEEAKKRLAERRKIR